MMMKEVEAKMLARAKELLESGEVARVVGWKKGDFCFDPTPASFESVDELYSIEAYGGGGTDFRPVFDYISDERAENLPACVIIYTDACGRFPDEADVPDIPILWLVNNNEETPPFGKTVRVGV